MRDNIILNDGSILKVFSRDDIINCIRDNLSYELSLEIEKLYDLEDIEREVK